MWLGRVEPIVKPNKAPNAKLRRLLNVTVVTFRQNPAPLTYPEEPLNQPETTKTAPEAAAMRIPTCQACSKTNFPSVFKFLVAKPNALKTSVVGRNGMRAIPK